jgi:hypothetical protein
MRYSIFLTLCVLVGLASKNAQASHYSAGFVTYRYIGDSTNTLGEYLVESFIYRPNADRFWGNANILVQITGCQLDTSLALLNIPPLVNRQHPLDSNLWTVADDLSCTDSSALNGMGIYRQTIVLNPCANYTFTLSAPCCRTLVDNYVRMPSVNNLEVRATLNNSRRQNSLPKPIHARYFPNLCLSKTFFIGGFQPDSDNDPNYVLPNSYSSANGPIPFDSGYSTYSPLPTSPPGPWGGYWVDSTSGITRITPSATGRYGLAFKYTERPFDTARGIYYTVGSYELDIIADVAPFCSPQDTIGLNLSFENSLKVQADTCGLMSSIIKTSQAMQFGSIDPGATDFSVFSFRRQAPEPVRSAQMLDGRTVKINYFFPLSANDTIRIISKIGADGNRIVNACGFDQAEGDTLYQVVRGCNVGLPDEEKMQLAVYPNPSYGIFKITNGSAHNVEQISVFSIQGAKLYSSLSANRQFDISHLRAGTYILNITLSNGENSQKKITLL